VNTSFIRNSAINHDKTENEIKTKAFEKIKELEYNIKVKDLEVDALKKEIGLKNRMIKHLKDDLAKLNEFNSGNIDFQRALDYNKNEIDTLKYEVGNLNDKLKNLQYENDLLTGTKEEVGKKYSLLKKRFRSLLVDYKTENIFSKDRINICRVSFNSKIKDQTIEIANLQQMLKNKIDLLDENQNLINIQTSS